MNLFILEPKVRDVCSTITDFIILLIIKKGKFCIQKYWINNIDNIKDNIQKKEFENVAR